jgi:hypothetical protein
MVPDGIAFDNRLFALQFSLNQNVFAAAQAYGAQSLLTVAGSSIAGSEHGLC